MVLYLFVSASHKIMLLLKSTIVTNNNFLQKRFYHFYLLNATESSLTVANTIAAGRHVNKYGL